MKISRQSWHYKLFCYISNVPRGPKYLNPFATVYRRDAELPSSLCPYAWSIFLGLLGTLMLSVVLLAGSVVVVPIFGAIALGRKIDARGWSFSFKRKDHAKKPEIKKEHRPSLVAAYVRANKEKACPMIELVD
jgi:hypothetical protein